MASSVQIPVTQTGLEASVQAALKSVGKSAQINLGTNARQINALAQPLGRITGQADEFTKSMEAANARVFAFGASVGIVNGVSKAFGALVKNTIAVEKSLVEINSVLGKSSSDLDKFGSKLFEVAKNTGQSFEAVSKGALELARQGLGTEETLKRINDALILTRLSGLDAGKSVEGLTAAVNSFKSTGITTSEVLNKLVNVSQKYAVSEKDLIEGLKRSSSVAKQAGVSFDELVGIITAVQEKSSVGGAVIGNSFKTIFTRLQRKDTLEALQQLGVEVTDIQGRILPATKLLENLAGKIKGLNQIQLAEITEKVGGGFQIDKLISTLEDLGSKGSIAFKATKLSAESANEAYAKNAVLNKTLANLINETTLSAQELGATLGKLGVTDSAKNLLGFFNSILEGIQKILGEESALGGVFRGLAKGIGNLITGPGLALFGAIILKLSKDLAQFGFSSLKSFFGIGRAAKEVETLEKSINQALASNVRLQQQLFNLEGNRAAQIQLMAQAVVQQETAMRRMASISSSLSGPLYQAGIRGTSTGLRLPQAAGGYMPAVAKESSDINRGVGGAKSGDRPVVIPNFNFGGGKKGSMVAHTGEYAVPNFNGSGGTAIFNRDMVRSMGLPSGAKKINAADGLIPNFSAGQYNLNSANAKPDSRNSIDSIVLSGMKPSAYLTLGKDAPSEGLFGYLQKGAKEKLEGVFGKNIPDNTKIKGSKIEFKNLLNSEYASGGQLVKDIIDYKSGKINKVDYIVNKIIPSTSGTEDDKFRNEIAKELQSRSGAAFIAGNVLEKVLFKKVADEDVKKNSNTWDLPDPLSSPFKKAFSFQSDFGDIKLGTTQKSFSSFLGKHIMRPDGKNAAKGFIPNFSKTILTDTVRQYYPELENYRVSAKKFVFPNGIEAYQSNIDNILKRDPSISKTRKQAEDKAREQKKLTEGVLDFNIDANSLGGIALVTPKEGDNSGYVSAQLKVSDLKDDKPQGLLDDDKIILNKIQRTGVPTKKNFQEISSEINKRFAGPIVSLAQSLYGRLYSGMQAGDFADQLGNLKSTSKGGILPPGAEGQIFEAASKAALTTMKDLSDSFDPSKENRPFDFTNPASMSKMLGVEAVRGDAKRGGGDTATFTKQINGFVKKSLNDGDLAPKILSQIRTQSKVRETSNAAGGFIPNFALSPKYIQETLGRIKDGTSGFSTQEQETFLRKFGSSKAAAGKGVSLRYLFDRDGSIGSKGLTDMVNAAYRQSSATASSDQVYKVFEGMAKREPSLSGLRRLASQKGFVPNFADPLKEAVGREMAAGVPASQIYIDKNQSLKSAANPMGLMVANRRDEPAGGHQGISRAIREGRDPKTYGAAGGFVPNYNNPYGARTMFTPSTAPSSASSSAAAPAQEEIKQAEKPMSDFVSKIFLLQSATMGLSGMFSELGEKGERLATGLTTLTTSALSGMEFWKMFKDVKPSKGSELLSSFVGSKSSETLSALQEGVKSGSVRGITGKIASASMKGGAIGRVAGGSLTLISRFAPLFSKLIPGIGLAVTGFQALNAGLKIFKIDLTKIGMDLAKGLGRALNIIDTEAESFAKKLSESTGQVLDNWARGEFGQASNLSDFLKTTVSEKEKETRAKNVGLESDADLEKISKKEREKAFEYAVFAANKDSLASAAGMKTEELQAQYTAGKGLQKESQTLLNARDVYGNALTTTSTKRTGFSDLQLEALQAAEAQLADQFGGKKEKKDLEKALKKGLSGRDLDPYMKALLESSRKNLGSESYSKIIEEIKVGGDYDTPEARKKLQDAIEKATKPAEKQVKLTELVDKENLSLLKQQLENRIAYKEALFQQSTAEEFSLEMQKEMLSFSEKDRMIADQKLSSLQAAKKLTLDQSKASFDILKNSDLLNAQLAEDGLGEINPKDFEKIAGISEKVADSIRQQGGYTEEVRKEAESLLKPLGLQENATENILKVLGETNNALEKQSKLEEKSNALNRLKTSILEAQAFALEKQKQAATYTFERESKSNDVAKRTKDIQLETFKINAERRKIGASSAQSIAIDQEIIKKEIEAVDFKLNLDKEDLLNQLRKTFTEEALNAGMTIKEVSDLNIKDLDEAGLRNIVSKIEEAEKKVKIEKIETALKEAKTKIEASNYHYDKVKESADIFKETITSLLKFNPFVAGSMKLAEKFGITLEGDKKEDDKKEKKPEKNALIEKLKKEAEEAIKAVKEADPAGRLKDSIDGFVSEVDLTSRAATNAGNQLKNSLLSAGASLQTFSKLVSDVFLNLQDEITQNKFSYLTATDPQSMISAALQDTKLSTLRSGPPTEDTIVAAADKVALLEKELEIKRSTTTEGRIAAEFELQKLKEILPLRLELLKAETDEERVKIIDKIIAKEKERLPLAKRLESVFTSSPEEQKNRLEDTIVQASEQFKSNMIDGISEAIEGGKSLGDVLQSSAYEFVKAINKQLMSNTVDSLVGASKQAASGGSGFLGNIMSSIGFASGGMISGGSGTKDDVPAMLMGGEYVINKKSVQKYGPQFLEALNKGTIGGYAKGGRVQSGKGGFFTPGTYGLGGIEGTGNLLKFATQAYTSGSRDSIVNAGNYASIALEPESVRLTNFGRMNSPQAAATRAAKEQAFGLYSQEMQAQAEARKQAEAQKDAFKKQLIMTAVMAVAGPIMKAGAAGFTNAFKAADGAGFLNQLGAGAKGIFTGGDIGGTKFGGLTNLFTGKFDASQIGSAEQLSDYLNKNPESKLAKNFYGNLSSSQAPKASLVGAAIGGTNLQALNMASGQSAQGFSSLRATVFGRPNIDTGTKQEIQSGQFAAMGGDINIGSGGIKYAGLSSNLPTVAVHPSSGFKAGDKILVKSNLFPNGREFLVAGTGPDPGRLDFFADNAQEYSNLAGQRINSVTKRAIGGMIPSTSGIDTIPAMLSGGEFIMNRSAAQNIGAGNLQALNAGAGSIVTEEKTEELNDKLIAKLDELIEASGGSGGITINVEGSTGTASEEKSGNPSDQKQQLARQIRDAVLKVIQEEKRLGGSLRR